MRRFVHWRHVAWAAICVLAIAARLTIMARTVGTNDIHTWESFAKSIRDIGLFETYRTKPDFNHPPLMGLWSLLTGQLCEFDSRWFPFVFKLLPLTGDLLAASLLYREGRRHGPSLPALQLAALFLWNPISLVITAYHGNTDPLMAAFCLWAALLASRNRPFLAALALGAALNVKVVPLLLILPLACSARNWRDLGHFGAGLAVACVPFVPVAVVVGQPLLEHVFKYNSAPGMWGFNLFLTDLASVSHIGALLGNSSTWFFAHARYVIIASITIVSAWSRFRDRSAPIELAAFALCVSLVFAPGFGFQYLAWPMPLFFVLDRRRALVTSILGGVLLIVLYVHFWDGLAPAFSNCKTWPSFGIVLGAFVWALLVAWSFRLTRAIVSNRSRALTR